MNYAGKFDAKLPIDGAGAHSHGHLHVDSVSAHALQVPAGAIIVPDAQLLFNGDFKRSGVDLVLSNDDHELVLHDYFKGEKRAALSSPDGAHLTGDIINALTGHQQFAQADGSASVAKVIGHVSKLAGTATAIRNGVSIILNNGDDVQKGDVVQAGSNSTLGVTFIDGTVFGLSSNAKMVLNEMVYDPNGSSNSSLISLVAGTISFVAGETAKHGDMKVDTPVATMGIRGTAVLVEIDFDVPQNGVPSAKFQVLVEPDGHTGNYVLFDKVTLAPIATVDQAGVVKSLSQGILTSYSAPLSADVQKLITDVFSLKFTDNTNPNTKSFDHYTDTLLPQAFTPIKLADGATAVPIIVNVNTSGTVLSSGPGGPLDPNAHIPGPPLVAAVDGTLIERIGVTHSSAIDTVIGTINFVDINKGDTPTVTTKFDSFTYQNAQHQDVSATLNAQQQVDIAKAEANLLLTP
ncbi:MAG TPA: FecR domain-containing protein, partial [Bradyrhizobium sp.]|nr:FecR domain-containing protein [Bradyrhizobium sp.]